MKVIVLSQGGTYDQMGCGGVKEHAPDHAHFGCPLGQVDICGNIQ
jgi:hypothetical protein